MGVKCHSLGGTVPRGAVVLYKTKACSRPAGQRTILKKLETIWQKGTSFARGNWWEFEIARDSVSGVEFVKGRGEAENQPGGGKSVPVTNGANYTRVS